MNPSELLLPILNTLLTLCLSWLVALPLSTALAILLVRSDVLGRSLARVTVTSQLAIPLYVFAGGWSAGIGVQGWLRLDYWLGPTGVGWMQSWLGSLLAVALIHGLAAIPWCCLIVSLGLLSGNRSEEDMAMLEGGWSVLLRYVWLPRLRPWLAVACLWCALGVMTEMVVSNLYMLPTVAETVYLDFSRDTVSIKNYLTATLLCALPIGCLGWILAGRMPPLSEILSKPLDWAGSPWTLGRYRWIISALLWLVLLFLVALPIISLIIKAGWTPVFGPSGIEGHAWTLRRFGQTILESVTLFQTEFYWSILLAICSTGLAILVSGIIYLVTAGGFMHLKAQTPGEKFHCELAQGTLVQGQLTSARVQLPRQAAHLLMLLLIALPGPLVGRLITFLFNRPGILGDVYTTTLMAPVLAQQFRLLPLAWLMWCGLEATIPQRTWELARADALSWRAMIVSFLWPHMRLGLFVLVVLLLLTSIGELSCSIGVLPPGVTTISMRLFELLHFGMRHQDSGLCGLLIAASWLATLSIWLAFSKK